MSSLGFCRHCGEPLPPQARFCKECGTPTGLQQQSPLPPQPSQSPPSAAVRSWPIAITAVAGLALVAGVVVVLVIATGNAGSGVRATVLPTVTNPAASHDSNTGAGSEEGSGETPSSAAQDAGSGSTRALIAYHGAAISAEIPSGWRTVEDEAHKPGYVESKWQDRADPGDTLLIDTSPATPGSLEQDASPVHEALTKQSGYSELFYGSGDLGDVQSWKWVFQVEGDRRVDYFFNRCASGFAVLGSTPPARFVKFEATFKTVAESVRTGGDSRC